MSSRVLVVDDHPEVRAALVRLVADDLGHEVVGEACDGDEALALCRSTSPEVVLLDVRLPGLSGADVAQAICRALPEVRIVALTADAEEATVATMLAAGADSYLVKTDPADDLRTALRRIFAGEVVLSPAVLPGVVADLAARVRTEHERAEAVLAVERSKREFLSLVSDRLATPLTTISGATKTLRSSWDRLDERLREELLDAIDRQCDRLTDRLRQILAVVRLHGDVDRDPEAFRVDEVVRDAVARIRAGHAGREVRLDATPLRVCADRTAIGFVIEALVDNALTHTPGSVHVRVAAEGTNARVEVVDEGPGLAVHELRHHLDEPFVVGDPSDSGGQVGLGLSLYAVARMVAVCNGEVDFDSAPERGTTAVLLLPLEPEGGGEAA